MSLVYTLLFTVGLTFSHGSMIKSVTFNIGDAPLWPNIVKHRHMATLFNSLENKIFLNNISRCYPNVSIRKNDSKVVLPTTNSFLPPTFPLRGTSYGHKLKF